MLRVNNLKTYFFTEEGIVKAVDGVNLYIGEGETLGLVGETGCGKTVTALSILRLIQEPGRIIAGEVLYSGEDLLKKSKEEMRKIRGREIAMIFQDPLASLNPVYTIGDQLVEVLRLHQKLDKKEALRRAGEIIKLVKLPSPEKILNQYPHELSGGMRQRAMIAIALSCSPKLLIADEPTTALDVTIQAQILELLKELMQKFRSSVLLITHNLGVVAEFCDRVAIMYAGNIVESADVRAIFKHPKHPYTKALMNAIPRLHREVERLEVIRGSVPDLVDPPSGCKFHPRCEYAMPVCPEKVPLEKEVDGHYVACHLYDAS